MLLILKNIYYEKSIREIEQSLKYILKSDTNNIISITSEDKEIKLLATSINEEIIKLRNQKLQYENGNQKFEKTNGYFTRFKNSLTAINWICRAFRRRKFK